MSLEEAFQLGYILKAHGLKGEVQAVFDVDFPDDYEDIDMVYLMTKGELVPYMVEDVNLQGSKAIMKLVGIITPEQAAALKGTKLYLPEQELAKLEEGQFYYHEIEGYALADENQSGGVVGTVATVYEYPQQTMLGVSTPAGEALVPLHDDLLVEIDHEAKRIVMRLPEGLISLAGDAGRYREE